MIGQFTVRSALIRSVPRQWKRTLTSVHVTFLLRKLLQFIHIINYNYKIIKRVKTCTDSNKLLIYLIVLYILLLTTFLQMGGSVGVLITHRMTRKF